MDRAAAADAQQVMMQRIAQRRQQLEAKLREKRNAGIVDTSGKTDGNEPTGTLGFGEEQVRASRRELAALKAAAAEAITRFRVMTDADENDRRIREEQVVARRDEVIAKEEGSAKKPGLKISFEHLHEHSVPQILFKELNLKKEACRAVLDVKDKLINELRSQLRDKEDEYVKSLKKQALDIDQLIEAMHGQSTTLAAAYHRELDAIEAAYAKERQELMELHAQNIAKIFRERQKEEEDLHAARQKKVWTDQDILDQQFEDNAEKFIKMKMDMQHEIHGLAQELEKLRARYILNMEKLIYNLQVLRERCKENKKAIELHRRKIGRLQEIVSTLNAKHAETDRKFRQVNTELTEAYRRVTEQFKDLQLKFQHFEKADAAKFSQVWDMHESDNMKLVHKCLQGDRVIFEELLGVAWAPPPLDFWGTAAGGGQAAAEAAAIASQAVAEEADADAEGQGAIELGEAGEAVLHLLYSQAPFLVDERVRKAISEMEEVEASHVKVDALLRVLNIKQTADVQKMLEYFISQTEDGQAGLITPEEAVLALQRFLQDRQQTRQKTLALDLSAISAEATKRAAQPTKRDLAAQRRKQEKEFWGRMRDVIGPSHLRIWTAVEKGLEKYLVQLQTRQKLIDETDGIRRQNDELRALLNQYLSSRLNEELFSPPQLQVVGARPTGSA